MISIATNRDGTLTVSCSSNSQTVTLAAGSTYAQCLSAYATIAPLSEGQAWLQAQLDDLLDNHFDLPKFIRAGTSTTVTATNVGTFLATIVDNYRTLRAQIAAATSFAQLNAININSGWPSNP